MIHLPESVTVVSLSATVSNAEEFGEWLETVRGETTTIVEERRPGPALPARDGRAGGCSTCSPPPTSTRRPGFVKEGAPVNGELMKVARDDWASTRLMRDRRSPRKGKPGSSKAKFSKDGRNVGNGRRVWIPSRADVVDRLDREGLLPAIVFIFSRVGCDAAVQQCLQAGRAADHPGGAGHDPRVRRGGLPRPAGGGPARPRLPRLPRRADPRHRRPPRRDAARVQARRRGALRPRAVQGGLRDRDPGAGHQHARPHRGHREADQVERRGARRHHAGGVHPAHRAGRPPRPRRRGARRRALPARHEPAARSPAWPRRGPTRSARPSGRRTTWRSTWSTSTAARPPASCSSSPSRSSRPTRPWSGWPGSCARPRRRSRATPSPRAATSGTSWSTPGCGAGSPTSRRAPARPGGPTAARRPSSRCAT